MDSRIGKLNSGKFYAYVNGHASEPVTGTLEEVEIALGLRTAPAYKLRKGLPQPRRRVAVLTAPDGSVSRFEVQAYTKAEARQKVADCYRMEFPASAGIYWPFSKQRLEWATDER